MMLCIKSCHEAGVGGGQVHPKVKSCPLQQKTKRTLQILSEAGQSAPQGSGPIVSNHRRQSSEYVKSFDFILPAQHTSSTHEARRGATEVSITI